MDTKELKALVSLLEDDELRPQIEEKIFSMGNEIIPFLEEEWGASFDASIQERIEEIVHTLQFRLLKERMLNWKTNESEDLLKGMWLIATYQYPDLSLEKITQDFEQLYYEIWPNFEPEAHPYDQIKGISNILFSKLRFKANTAHFHSPANSMINSVLESKRGNPIALSVIYMLITQKLNMPVYGVNLPNFFIITYNDTDKNLQFYVNAFNRGLIFTKQDIDHYLGQVNINPHPKFYTPCTHIDIITRVLRNLIVSFEKLNEHHKADEVKQLLGLFDA
ncbi:MAG: transglutaminase-like domain-containing protein [Cyclobacteriaceae bacterium]|nr:transglutaminase-like domain-containing protein [Cyclobacteriaceae bacterium]